MKKTHIFSKYKRVLIVSVIIAFLILTPPTTRTFASDLITGWSRVVGYTNSMDWYTPDKGNLMLLIEAQLKNESALTQKIELGSILLEDSKGNSYECKTSISERQTLETVHLLPGEVFWYRLGFEVPHKIQAKRIMVWGANDYGPSVKIPIKNEEGNVLENTYKSNLILKSQDYITINQLNISQKTELSGNIAKVTLTFENNNTFKTTKDTFGCGIFGCFVGLTNPKIKEGSFFRIYAPFVKGSYGRYAKPLERFVTYFPDNIPKSGESKENLRFNITKLAPPLYLGIGFMSGNMYEFNKRFWKLG